MTDRRKKAAVTGGTLLQLVCIGLVGAATIFLFSVASVSLLDDRLTGSRIGDDVFRYPDGNAAPPVGSMKFLPAVLPQAAATAEVPEIRGRKPGLDLASIDRDASTTTSEARDVGLMPVPRNTKTQSTEASGSGQAAIERRPIGEEMRAMAGASRRTAPSEIPDEDSDELSRNIASQQRQPAKLDQGNLASDEKALAQDVPNQGVHHHSLSPDAAFRSRVRKECGPINDPALHRHCVATFHIYYR
jgi:hypothetical protein